MKLVSFLVSVFFIFNVCFAKIQGDLGLTVSEEDLNFYAKAQIEESNYKLGAEIDKAEKEGKRTRDLFRFFSEYERNFEKFSGILNFEFERDKVRDFFRSNVLVGAEKDFDFKEVEFSPRVSLGYSFSDILADSVAFCFRSNTLYKFLYHNFKVLLPLEETKEVQIDSILGSEYKISENVSLKFEYDFRFLNAFEDKYEHVGRIKVCFVLDK